MAPTLLITTHKSQACQTSFKCKHPGKSNWLYFYAVSGSWLCDLWRGISWSCSASALLDLSAGNPPVIGGFPSQRASNPEDMTVFLAATKQLNKWYFPSVCLSVCPSVCLSVCHTFFTMFPSSYHHEIFRSYYHGQEWCPCKRSRSEVKGQGHRGQHPT